MREFWDRATYLEGEEVNAMCKELTDPSVIALFELTRSRVTDQHVIDFSPNDPGYPEYCRLWLKIRRSGKIPRESEFDLSEVIGLTGWGDPEKYPEPDRFVAYRRFTTAVALALIHQGNDSEMVRPANYLARDLLVDLNPDCKRSVSLVRDVLESTRKVLREDRDEEGFPFFTFASMILAQMNLEWQRSETLASRLIVDEQTERDRCDGWVGDHRFLLGITCYDQLHKDWLRFAEGLKNPTNHEDTQLVIEALSGPR